MKSSPRSRRRRSTLVAVAVVVVATVLSQPAGAAGGNGTRTRTSSWPTPTTINTPPAGANAAFWFKTVVLSIDPNDVGQTVSIEWSCGGTVVQSVSGTIQSNAFGTGYAGVGFAYPATWGTAPPPSNCILSETVPTTVGVPNPPELILGPAPRTSVSIFHP